MPLETVDTLISGSKIVTMDGERRIYRDGALAIKGNRIAAIGPRSEVEKKYRSENAIDGSRFVITPGFINGHIHITGDPLTRGYVPDDIDCGFEERLTKWVIPRYLAHSPDDERLSAQFAALEMLRSGTTCFLEAGTIRYLNEVVDGLNSTGIRGRVGIWVEGRGFDPSQNETQLTQEAIRKLEDEVVRFPASDDARIAAWPILVGHSLNTDEVWKAAKSIADDRGLGVSAHMSPYEADPDWYVSTYGRRPIEHLAHIDVLGDNVSLTHVAHIDRHELEILTETGTNVVLCPFAALRGAFGITSVGLFPEMAAAGVNILLGTDGGDCDIQRLVPLMASLFKDARQDMRIFPAHEALTMVTLNAASAMGLRHEIGSLEVGKKADFVCHDTDRPEWHPLLNVLNQLVWSADGRGVHSVWVDGMRVIDDYHSTLIDEDELYGKVQKAGEEIIKRSGVPSVSPWPVI